MDCKIASELLPLYFDGELDRTTSRELETHLDGCANCRDALIGLDALHTTLREESPRHARWLAVASSWVVMFAAGGAWMSMRNHAGANDDAQSQISRDMFAGHWRALAANSPFDVVSTDQHTVKPWFAGKVSVAPLVQDFTAQGFALVGGRIDLIDVFVLSPSHAPALDKPIQSQGYLRETVMLGGQLAAIVSDMGGADLAHFAQLLGSVK